MNNRCVDTLKELIEQSADRFGDKPAFRILEDDNYCEITYSQLQQDITAFGRFLAAQSLLNKHIALLGPTTYDWIVCFYGIANHGSVAIPIDKELGPESIIDLLVRSEADCLIFDAGQLEVAKYIASSPDCKIKLICMKENDIFPFIRFANIDSAEIIPEIAPDSLAAIVFTSGTTGKSKGVMLTHRNFAHNTVASFRLNIMQEDTVTLALLPIHHAFQLTCCIHLALFAGATICIGQGIKGIMRDMQHFKPTLLIIVPMIAKGILKTMLRAIEKAGKGRKVERAFKLSRFLLKFGVDVRRKFFQELLAPLGGNLNTIVSGGAFLEPEIGRWFDNIGVDFYNGYGITECSPVVSCNNKRNKRYKSIGKPVDFCRIKIVAGEILVKGSIVSQGYYRDQATTAQSYSDGWFKTGDLGYLDADGYLYITGRKKNTIVLDNGENISPEELEGLLYQCPLIKEALVYSKELKGNQILAAKIHPDMDVAQDMDSIADVIEMHIAKINRSLPKYKQIQDFSLQQYELSKTSTGKIKRD